MLNFTEKIVRPLFRKNFNGILILSFIHYQITSRIAVYVPFNKSFGTLNTRPFSGGASDNILNNSANITPLNFNQKSRLFIIFVKYI